ncbi:uncharacterized protein LOC113504854 [Trichoplusia ni]|uniref:Uncharacterized protein LOC113504854 n=1 Tax=Trichoplusia ni TaxID=7111 RepID=A0A7E5WQU5_TRINI|nr:uncharacterized protein LOC113504854 [Trichoplusia ni]
MCEDIDDVSRKTWARSLEPVTKIGYMDGASDGQSAVFQQSFDVGYEQGLNFGLEIGFKDAIARFQPGDIPQQQPQDQCKINCQICLNGVNSQENIGNLYNIQKEKNSDHLRRL